LIKDFKDPRHQPISAKKIREQEREDERRRQEAAERPVREAEVQLIENHRKLHELGKKAVVDGRPDPGWVMPLAAVGLKMSLEKAQEFNAKEAELFVARHPEWHKTPENFRVIRDYLANQKVGIVTADCWEQAFERLTAFNLLEERPQPAPKPAPAKKSEALEPGQPPFEVFDDGDLTPGWDQNGQPRNYTQREVHHMSADEYKRAFKLWVTREGDRRPRINRSMYL
jgi:hypothetical protein